MKFRSMSRCAVAAVVAVGLACRAGGGSFMTNEPVPPGWAQDLASERQAKDRQFRESPDTPLPKEDLPGFRGLDYWPPDPAYRFVGAIEINERLERFTIVTTTGQSRPCERFGRVFFRLAGREHSLSVYRLLDMEPRPGMETFFLPFLDETSGKETYPAGRYVDLEGPRGGPYALDFNRAYSPWCAYGAPERYACPTTPRENRLRIRVEAGERGFRKHPSVPP